VSNIFYVGIVLINIGGIMLFIQNIYFIKENKKLKQQKAALEKIIEEYF
jgi:hypothetical protein